jgi:cell division protein FtsN
MPLLPPQGLALFPFVLGFATALVLAAAVALYITQAPVPFVDRGIQRPQGTISGAPPETAQPSQKAGASSSPLNDEARTGAQPAPMAPPPVLAPPALGSGASGTPSAGALPPGLPPSASTGAPATPDVSGQAASASQFFLQVAAFKSSEEADQMRARLAFMGFEAQISQGKRENLVFYRVRLGPYKSFEELNRVKTSLSDNGLESTVVRSPQ